ncbi:MAG: HK97 family phage prohead protease [Spirochaetaceae bacterium]|jgi:HK97 family phage prohead protease|nr:HK97 family phage prohead protease [Spirochaetaceae bacterium]
MFVRTGNGTARIENRAALLDFLCGELGMRRSEGGIKTTGDGLDVECIASVPFCLAGESDRNGIPWAFSTFDLDRLSERIDPAGWDYSHYQKNPVVEWAHRYDVPAIGKAEGLFTDEKGLHGSVVFNDKEYDPFGWAIGERVRHGVIRAGSVGFRILEIELPSKEDGADGTSLIFRKQELLEFSICNVPANPFALTKKGPEEQKKELSPFWGAFIGGING